MTIIQILAYIASVPAFIITWILFPRFTTFVHPKWTDLFIRRTVWSIAISACTYGLVLNYDSIFDKNNKKIENTTNYSNNDSSTRKEISNSKVKALKEEKTNIQIPNQNKTESIEDMEKRVGYSGDDSIIRSRLGLPPK